MAMTKAVFLDKDGTLIQNIPYNVDPALIRFLPGVEQGLQLLCRAGYRLIILSNQPGVALGMFLEESLRTVHLSLSARLAERGIPLSGFYYCPHDPRGLTPLYAVDCGCRKPRPGLLFRAAAEHAVVLEESWMIGDILDDIEAGCQAGCRTVLINNGNETEWKFDPFRVPDFFARDFQSAVQFVLENHIVSEMI